MVRILPQNRSRPNQERTESGHGSCHSWPEISADEISGQGAAGTGDRETERPRSGRPRYERWRGHIWLVCAESVSAPERGELETGNRQGEKVAHPEGSDRHLRLHAARELRPIHLAGSPEQTRSEEVEGQGAADESLRAGHFCRGG